MELIEIRARTVELAEQAALEELGLKDRNRVEWEILQEPARGFLGVGRQDAIVRAKRKPAKRRRGRGGRGEKTKGRQQDSRPKRQKQTQARGSQRRQAPKAGGGRGQPAKNKAAASVDEQAEVARSFVAGLLEAVDMDGEVKIKLDDDLVALEVRGEETEPLVGPRGSGIEAVIVFRSSLTAEELQARIDAWIEHVYGREPHSGLDGMSPFERVQSWTGEPPRTVSEQGMSVLLAPAAGDGRRKVSKKAISVDGGRYMAGELGKWADQWVHVRQDPDDLGRIFVFTEADAAGRHAFICIAEDPARTGIDRREVAVEARRGWSARTSAARKRARDLKREHAPHEAIEAVLEKARQDAGKVVALKPKGDEHATPATESAKAAEAAKDAAPESRRRRVNDPDRITQLWGENL